ncbi:MAG: hypothetical protein NC043_05355 [Muribaculaceae bacterium]|nr:hypothetical protein [Muribaculaceae bacterium]
MRIDRHIILAATVITAVIAAAGASAQGVNSPYSKFGYGLLNDNATASQRQMGGIGYAMNSGRQINVMNPASYAFIDSLTFLFDMGVDFTAIHQSDIASGSNPAASGKNYGGGLDYITMQLPLSKRLGLSFGLVPYSSVGYSFGSEIQNGVNSRQGSGGLNQLYAGLGAKIMGGLSVGVNMSYLFGNIINDIYTTTNTASESLFEQVISVRDWHLQAGVQYSQKLGLADRLTVGVVYTPKKTLLGHAWVTQYDINADTEPNEHQRISLKNNAGLPETWGAGINYEWRRRLMVEADFTYQPWSKVKIVNLEGFEAHKFADRWQASLGGQFTPNPRGGYLGRTTYRLGGFFNNDYMMVGDNRVREYGVSFGFGLPTATAKTIINLGFEYRHRQAHPNPMLKENYFNIRLGLNFNELWFFKNKID